MLWLCESNVEVENQKPCKDRIQSRKQCSSSRGALKDGVMSLICKWSEVKVLH